MAMMHVTCKIPNRTVHPKLSMSTNVHLSSVIRNPSRQIPKIAKYHTKISTIKYPHISTKYSSKTYLHHHPVQITKPLRASTTEVKPHHKSFGKQIFARSLAAKTGYWSLFGCISLAGTAVAEGIFRYYELDPYYGLSFLAVTGGVALGQYAILRYASSRVATSMGGYELPANHPKYAAITSIVNEVATNAELGAVPQVYLIPTREQNAFATGFSKKSYALGITEGLLDNLNTKELAAVIGHEIGHMKNGDTNINMHLIAINAGFYFAYWLGRRMLEHKSSSNNNNNNKGKGNAQVLGLGLAAVGLSTYLLGNFFRLAISRRREFEADASSVAFVGDNKALASALRKISQGTVPATAKGYAPALASPLQENSDMYGHMFIASAANSTSTWDSISNLFSTHPPMHKRIEQLEQMGDFQLQSNQARIGPASRPLIKKK